MCDSQRRPGAGAARPERVSDWPTRRPHVYSRAFILPCRDQRIDTGDHELHLPYQPPYAWAAVQGFLARRLIEGLEWIGDACYGRNFTWSMARGHFTATHDPPHHRFRVTLTIDDPSAVPAAADNIRRILDVDADTRTIETHLARAIPGLPLIEGMRLPGIWSQFEAGIRAVLGQQVSIGAARRLTQTLVHRLGEPGGEHGRQFPAAARIADSDLAFLGMPAARRAALRRLAEWHVDGGEPLDANDWLALKGIGPWTVDYARMRGASHPDVLLARDLGVKKALSALGDVTGADAAPWRSYLTLQLWNR